MLIKYNLAKCHPRRNGRTTNNQQLLQHQKSQPSPVVPSIQLGKRVLLSQQTAQHLVPNPGGAKALAQRAALAALIDQWHGDVQYMQWPMHVA